MLRELLLRGLLDGRLSTPNLVDRIDRTSGTRVNTHYARSELAAMEADGLVKSDTGGEPHGFPRYFELTDLGRSVAADLGVDEGRVLDFGLLRRRGDRVVVDESVGTYSAVLILSGGAVVWRPLGLDGLTGEQLAAVEARLVQEIARVRSARGRS